MNETIIKDVLVKSFIKRIVSISIFKNKSIIQNRTKTPIFKSIALQKYDREDEKSASMCRHLGYNEYVKALSITKGTVLRSITVLSPDYRQEHNSASLDGISSALEKK